MPRFSLKWLLIAVAYIAISVGALLNANRFWRSSLESSAVALVLIALAGVIWSAGERRAFWGGSLLFGAIYLLWSTGLFGLTQSIRFPPTDAFSYIHRRSFTPTTEIPESPDLSDIDYSNEFVGGVATLQVIRPGNTVFTAVGNAVLAIPFALLGGVIATAFYRRRVLQ
jgi:hypothetical protein